MQNAFSHMEILLGDDRVERLCRAKIAIFGVGGVGSYAAEALARCGVGSLTLVDPADISASDVNRHLYALRSSVGRSKVQAAKARIRDIDEDILVHTYETFYNEDTASMFDFHAYDYVVDAMDTVESKLLLIEQAKATGVPVLSCMGTANKIDPSRFEIADISKTSVCPVAKAVRAGLRRKGIRRVKVLFSRERPVRKDRLEDAGLVREEYVYGSIAFVPGVAGMMIAGEVVRDLTASAKRNAQWKKQDV